ncbi:DUF3902 family protein [Lysinibacillus telephonicus]
MFYQFELYVKDNLKEAIMGKINYGGIAVFVFSLTGFIFSMMFQSMAYWGADGTLTMEWYWVGAILSYFCSIIAIVLMSFRRKNLSTGEKILHLISTIIIILSLLWTTFIIIAWQSGF